MNSMSDTDPSGECFSLSDAIAWRRIGSEGFLITRDGKSTHTVNKTGVRILELAAAGRSMGEVIEAMCREFAVSREVALAETREFLDAMVARKILLPAKEPTATQSTSPAPVTKGVP